MFIFFKTSGVHRGSKNELIKNIKVDSFCCSSILGIDELHVGTGVF